MSSELPKAKGHWAHHMSGHHPMQATSACPEDPSMGWGHYECWSGHYECCVALWCHTKSPRPETMQAGFRCLSWVTSGKPLASPEPWLPQLLTGEGAK